MLIHDAQITSVGSALSSVNILAHHRDFRPAEGNCREMHGPRPEYKRNQGGRDAVCENVSVNKGDGVVKGTGSCLSNGACRSFRSQAAKRVLSAILGVS
jgi:hypothetical protein